MGVKRSGKDRTLSLEIYGKFFIGFVLICTARIAVGVTNPSDVHGALNLITGIVLIELVTAINSLYISLGFLVLPGWVSMWGDPCGEAWQGIVCNASEIQSIILNGANLGGELGDNLGMFASIRSIDLSNNHIGGSIPSNLPATMLTFFLADNNFTGSIPDSLSSLTLLNDMSLNDNFLSGEIPDVFQSLPGLINLDLLNTHLSGQLPSSFVDLASLTTLNIENNLFSGPIPDKLLAIPNFRKDGNPFNSSTSPVPAPTSLPASTPPPPTPPTPTTPFWGPPSPSSRKAPGKQADGPSSAAELNSGGKKFLTTKRLVWICIAGVLLFAILALALVLLIPKCSRRRGAVRHQVGAYKGNRENPRDNGSLAQPTNQIEKGK
uniref:Leucine-rich repeat-containing N-terminal plant-type domain-containing protein n=1 Tax=Salix viminalis TaxID=40686 RepID=A0A6N2LSR3_SALVM